MYMYVCSLAKIESTGLLHMQKLPTHVHTYLYCIVSETTDDFVIVILQAVHTLTVLTVALDASERVPRIFPVTLHVL